MGRLINPQILFNHADMIYKIALFVKERKINENIKTKQ